MQVSVEFAGLHDTPGRMQEKGVITVSLFFFISFIVSLLIIDHLCFDHLCYL